MDPKIVGRIPMRTELAKNRPYILCHFNQFGNPRYTLHTCRNFGFGTLSRSLLHLPKNSAGDHQRPKKSGYMGWPCQSIWHFAKMTVTSITSRRFERPHYALLLNWLKWHSKCQNLSILDQTLHSIRQGPHKPHRCLWARYNIAVENFMNIHVGITQKRKPK